ncbi:MAG: phosphotransferase [Rhodopirellula baltica]
MDVSRIARLWFPDAASVGIDSWNPGLSGGRVYRIRPAANPSSYVLKCSASGEPIARWHRVANELANAMTQRDVSSTGLLDPTWSNQNVGSDSALLAAPLPTADGRWIVVDQGRQWQCTAWVDGKACDDSEAMDSEAAARALLLGGEAIAKVHSRLAALPSPVIDRTPSEFASADHLPRCFRERMRRLHELNPWLSSGSLLRERLPGTALQWRALLERCVSVDGVGQRTIDRANDELPAYQELAHRLMAATELLVEQGTSVQSKLIAELADRLESSPQGWRLNWVLRDVHREHILFDESRETVNGIIDHDAMDWDCPVVDLARWAGSFPVQLEGLLSASRLELAVEGYNRISSANCGVELADGGQARSFLVKSPTPEEIALGATLLRLNAWVGMANWVDWIGLRRRVFFSSPERLSSRISGLIDSVCHFC